MKYDYSWLDRPTLERFKAAYEQAKNAGAQTFTYMIGGEPQTVLASFAKYLIEWRENELTKEKL